MNYIGENLKKIRGSKGITQDEIAEVLEVKRQTYSAYERGVTVPDAICIKKLADFLEVSADEILEEPPEKPDILMYATQGGGDLTDKQRKEVEMFVDFIKARDSIDNE